MDDYKPIENYGIIGDLNTVAFVGLDGSIDFLCSCISPDTHTSRRGEAVAHSGGE